MTMYRQGLKFSVKAELMRCGGTINTLDELINQSIEYDNKLYELNRETRTNRNTAPAVGRTTKPTRKFIVPRNTHYIQPYRPNKPIRTWHDPDAMDTSMNILGRGGKKSYGKPGRQNDSKERLCYGCGKPGHIARNCRSKAPMGKRMLNVISRPDASDEEDWDTCGVVPSIEDNEEPPILDRERCNTLEDYIKENKVLAKERFDTNQDLIKKSIEKIYVKEAKELARGRVKTMSLSDLEDGFTQLRVDDTTTKLDLRRRFTPVLKETIQQALRQEEEMSELDLNEIGPDSPASDSAEEEEEYLSAEEEGPPRKKARNTPTLRNRAPTPHPEFRETEESENQAFKGYNRIVRDIPGFTIFQDHTEEEHQILKELVGDIQTDYERFWKEIMKEINIQVNLTPEARITLIQDLLEDHNDHLDNDIDHVAQMFKRGRLTPKRSIPPREDEENDIHNYLREGREVYFQRAILNAQETDWLEKAKAEGKAYRESIDGPDPQPIHPTNRYAMDYRNVQHGTISSHHCVHQTCTIHYPDKYGTGYFPKQINPCKYLWWDCKKDTCADHLWDKRSRAFFPGTEDPAAVLNMRLLVNKICTQTEWQTCLHPECETHEIAKEFYGFGKKGPDPFLDQRTKKDNAAPSTRKH
jgi:hypothetical protein